MEEDNFINLLDQADRDLDAFPFWASFKRACAEHSIRGIKNLTPGRQALLILWEASSQGKDQEGKIINSSIEGEDMHKKIEKLKSDLIGHFMNEEMDEEALKRFFRSIKKAFQNQNKSLK